MNSNSEEKRVKMAELKVGETPEILVTIGLGSCVGVALYDKRNKIGGLVHIMLPENKKNSNPAKYADTGIPHLIDQMQEQGARRRNLAAKIVGGARMFNISEDNNGMNIGARNIKAVEAILEEENIDILGKDVGADYGRSMWFFTQNGEVLITSHQKENVML